MTLLRAGAAIVDITPPVGGLMDGYGGRTKGSKGVHDPLMARALVLDDGKTRVAIVSCDLLGLHPDITTGIRKSVGVEHVLVAATHDHAGPAGLRGGMFARLDDGLSETLVGKLTAAIEEAAEALRPAMLKVGQATVETVSMNRRDPEWPIDPVMRVLLVEGEGGPIASILNFACHATVMTGANLMLSGEFPGAAARLLHEQTGAPCIYLNGACGDVNPTWVRQDFESVERVGQIVGGQALRVVGELRTLGPGQRVHNIRWDEFPEKRVPGRIVEPGLRTARREIELPRREFGADEVYAERIEEVRAKAGTLDAGSDERRTMMAQLTRTESERWAAAWARREDAHPSGRQPEKASQRTEIQALRLGDGLAVLALPGEFFVETAAAIRGAVAQGRGPEPQGEISDLFVACYANDYIGYVIPEHSYDEGGYESGITFCGPEAEGIIVDASVELLREVMSGPS
jgi:hypothetical protein